MQPSAWEDFTELCCHENFNAYTVEPHYEILGVGGMNGCLIQVQDKLSQFALTLHSDLHNNLQFKCKASIVSGISALKEISKYAQA